MRDSVDDILTVLTRDIRIVSVHNLTVDEADPSTSVVADGHWVSFRVVNCSPSVRVELVCFAVYQLQLLLFRGLLFPFGGRLDGLLRFDDC
jgi:hypothetical protein